MKTTKRIYTETIQAREYAVKPSGVGMEWKPRIEKTYEFCDVEEFLRTFPPKKPSTDLIKSITKAYHECDSVTYNIGNGNKTYWFTK